MKKTHGPRVSFSLMLSPRSDERRRKKKEKKKHKGGSRARTTCERTGVEEKKRREAGGNELKVSAAKLRLQTIYPPGPVHIKRLFKRDFWRLLFFTYIPREQKRCDKFGRNFFVRTTTGGGAKMNLIYQNKRNFSYASSGMENDFFSIHFLPAIFFTSGPLADAKIVSYSTRARKKSHQTVTRSLLL